MKNSKQHIESKIKAGWVAALISAAITFALTMYNYFMPSDGLYSQEGLYLLIDVGLILVLAVFIYKKSRIAATVMFLYFLASKIIIMMETGQPSGIVMGVVFLFFYGNAMIGTFQWHKLKHSFGAADAFD